MPVKTDRTEPKINLKEQIGMESHQRSIAKAVTWRIIATLITSLVAYLLTREVVLAMGIGFLDASIKIFAYYGHERLWNRIDFGREKGEDYTL